MGNGQWAFKERSEKQKLLKQSVNRKNQIRYGCLIFFSFFFLFWFFNRICSVDGTQQQNG